MILFHFVINCWLISDPLASTIANAAAIDTNQSSEDPDKLEQYANDYIIDNMCTICDTGFDNADLALRHVNLVHLAPLSTETLKTIAAENLLPILPENVTLDSEEIQTLDLNLSVQVEDNLNLTGSSIEADANASIIEADANASIEQNSRTGGDLTIGESGDLGNLSNQSLPQTLQKKKSIIK